MQLDEFGIWDQTEHDSANDDTIAEVEIGARFCTRLCFNRFERTRGRHGNAPGSRDIKRLADLLPSENRFKRPGFYDLQDPDNVS